MVIFVKHILAKCRACIAGRALEFLASQRGLVSRRLHFLSDFLRDLLAWVILRLVFILLDDTLHSEVASVALRCQLLSKVGTLGVAAHELCFAVALLLQVLLLQWWHADLFFATAVDRRVVPL